MSVRRSGDGGTDFAQAVRAALHPSCGSPNLRAVAPQFRRVAMERSRSAIASMSAASSANGARRR